jgi:type I restriction enzyme R subunit
MPDNATATAVPSLPPVANEDAASQIPALDLLRQLGWEYLSPDDADRLRGGRKSDVLLTGILRAQLARMNAFEYRGQRHPFGEGAIQDAIADLTNIPDDGLVRTNERVWDLLRLGRAVPQTVDWDRRSYDLQYVDWERPERNVYHVTEEFEVEAAGTTETRRPDIVCFVNGIPFVVIECKPAALPGGRVPVEEGISQHIRNQGANEIPRLFHYAQLLLSLAVREARYGATGTPLPFWFGWRERELPEADLVAMRGARPAAERTALRDTLMASRFRTVMEPLASYDAKIAHAQEVTEQDRLLWALCQPRRLLELVRHYTLFEAGDRKVARYQQYFAVRDVIAKVRQRRPDGSRVGGVVWHTQGSGKSLTMVMLADAILREFGDQEPRIVLVTDRVDLDDQIYDTFRGAGVGLVQADSGEELRAYLTDPRAKIVTTLVHKFARALKTKEALAADANVFVLADEGHRTHGGTLNAAMRIALPKAAYIGFTGTPILKGDKQTVEKFGGIIGQPYTIRQAVEDHAVVPLVYEGRHTMQHVQAGPMDAWFEKYTKGLTPAQQADLKRKYSTSDRLNEAEQKIRAIAWDVSVHFQTNFQGKTPFKGQLVAPSKEAALLYKRFLDEFRMVSSEVLISAPDTREGHTEVDEVDTTSNRPSVLDFWAKTMKRFSSEETYRKDVINRFKKSDEPEIIIVVDMLLTGFDAPRNAVLYLTRPLKEHTLLQAIARVNRVYAGKDHGLIIDYYGVLSALDEALDLYTALDGKYDKEDLGDVMTDIRKAIADLPQKHAALWDVFKTVANKHDHEAMEKLLGDEEMRSRFYDALGTFARGLKLALSSVSFHADTEPALIERYRQDFKYFLKLRASAAQRYAEAVDFRQYEGPIQKLIDTYVGAGEVQTVVQPVDIFDRDAFKKEVEQFSSPEAKAEVIANRIRHTIHAHLEEDPVFYRRLSEMLEETYERYERERLEQVELLRNVEEILERAQSRERDEPVPAVLEGRDLARTYHDLIGDVLSGAGTDAPEADTAALAVAIDDVIERLKMVNWEQNVDVQNRMRTMIEDELFRFKDAQGLTLPFDAMDRLMDGCIEVARRRSARA